MSLRKSAVSNSGPLIHLARAGLLDLLQLYNVVMSVEVKYEVVDRGKEKGFSNAFLVEKAVEDWIGIVDLEVDSKFDRVARVAGLHEAEITVIYYAYRNNLTALLDDDAARVFTRDLGVEVRGSLGVLVKGLREGAISYSKAVEGLDSLSEVMYLSSDIYRLALKELESKIR